MATLAELLVKIGVDADEMGKGTEAGASKMERALNGLQGPAMVAGGLAAGALAVGFTAAMDISAANTKLSNQLGLTEAESERAGAVAGSVFSGGFGENLGQVNEAIRGVHTNIGAMGDFTDAELEGMTTNALALASTFDQDVSQSTIAVGQLMKNGLADDAEHAFDIITAGFQSGADRSGDLLDTVTEYGTQFRNLGLDGETAMGMISQGLQGGARDADVVADALKEFSIEAVAGSDRVRAGYDALGMDADDMFAKMGEGGDSAAGALDSTLDTLREVEDPVERNAIATELFGTKAEDLGDALYALDPTTATLENVTGATEDMSDAMADDPSQQMSAALRTITTMLGEMLLPVLLKVSDFVAKHPTLFKIIATAVIVAAVAFGVLAAALWIVNAAVLANPITWIIIAIIAGIALLIAAIVLIVVKWDEIVAWTVSAWESIKAALAAAWGWVKAKAAAFGAAVSGFFSGLWSKISNTTSSLWAKVTGFFRAGMDKARGHVQSGVSKVLAGIALLRSIPTRVREFFSQAASAALSRITALIGHVKSIPGKIRSAIGNAGNMLKSAGRNIIQGLISGVTGMIGSLRNKFSEITGMIPDWKGPMRVDRVLLAPTGEAIMGGLGTGIEAGLPGLRKTLRGVTTEIPHNVNANVRSTSASETHVVLDVQGTDRELVSLVRKMVADRGGDVQKVLGKGR